MIRCLAHVQTRNLGDRVSSPGLYVQGLPRPEEILGAHVHPTEDVVVGGGGWLRHEALLPILARARRVILWGVGENIFDGDPQTPPPRDHRLIAGVRDYPLPTLQGRVSWVPCASCLSPAFDVPRSPTLAVVAFAHYERPLPHVKGLPVQNNADFTTLADALDFIGSGELVITNSYHGMYWATLLGRRVIAYPYASRFRAFKWPVLTLHEGRDWREYILKAPRHQHALQEARAAQAMFFDQVHEMLGYPPDARLSVGGAWRHA